MKWEKYRCIVDKYGLIANGQEFMICGTKAKDMDGNTLDIETKFVKRHSNPETEDSYDFEFIEDVYEGEGKEIAPDTDVGDTKAADSGLQKKKKGRYIVLSDYDADLTIFDDEDEARAVAESETGSRAIVAEIKAELKIKKITKWEA